MKKNSSSESGILSVRLLLALGLCSIGAWFALISVAAPAPSAPQAPTTTITVTTAVQKLSISGGCSLQVAILSSQHHSSTFAAPNNPAVTIMSGCTAGSGNDTIVLPGGAVFQMSAIIDDPNNFTGPAANPMIRSNIIIEANGSRIEHVPNGINFRAFAVGYDGSLAIRNAHIKGFTFKGGDGYGGGGGGIGADFSFFDNGQNGQWPGGGGGGGGAGDSSTFHWGGTGGNGEYGGGGGGVGEAYGASDGGNGGFGGGGGASAGRGIFASAEGGDGGFGGGGATSNEIPGAGGKLGGNASEAHAGGGAALGGGILYHHVSVTNPSRTYS